MGAWLEECKGVEPQDWQQGVWQLEGEEALVAPLGRWALGIVDQREKLLSPSPEH